MRLCSKVQDGVIQVLVETSEDSVLVSNIPVDILEVGAGVETSCIVECETIVNFVVGDHPAFGTGEREMADDPGNSRTISPGPTMVKTSTYMKPAPLVIKMFLMAGSGLWRVVPVRMGATRWAISV
jgi:hypothetical protein